MPADRNTKNAAAFSIPCFIPSFVRSPARWSYLRKRQVSINRTQKGRHKRRALTSKRSPSAEVRGR